MAGNPADSSPLAALGQQVSAGARTLSRLFHDELSFSAAFSTIIGTTPGRHRRQNVDRERAPGR